MTPAEQIRKAMDAKGIGIEPLAVAAGIHSQSVRKVLHGGDVRISTLQSLATALQIRIVISPAE